MGKSSKHVEGMQGMAGMKKLEMGKSKRHRYGRKRK